MGQSKKDKVLQLTRKLGILRPRDLEKRGIPREHLRRLYLEGHLQKIGRGLYSLVDHDLGERHNLAEACKRIPHGVICLLSALRFHELTSQVPFEVWLAIDPKARLPKKDSPPLRIVRFSGKALKLGVERHQVEGVPLKVFNPAKTVADCFKYRNKIGLEVALEALRDCRREKKCTMDDLWKYAKICRVSNVMRPYLESLT